MLSIEMERPAMISAVSMGIRANWASRVLKRATEIGCAAAAVLLFAHPASAQVEHIGRAVAIVNDDVISEFDVERRMTLVLASTGAQLSGQERQQLRAQVMRSLVDERLQAQEAEEYDIAISPQIVSEQFQRVAANFNQSTDQFEEFLAQNGTSRSAFEDKIKSDITWSQLVQRRIDPLVSIGDDEVEEVIQRLEDSKGQFEYNLSEIYLGFTPTNEVTVQSTAQRIAERIKEGASFEAFARQFSEAATAAVGGDLGWVIEDQLDPTLRPIAGDLRVNQVSEAIRGPGGYYVVMMKDRRRILSADPLDTQYDLQQIFWSAENSEDPSELERLTQVADDAANQLNSCADVEAIARSSNANDSGPIGALRLRDLPAQLQEELRTLEGGDITKPLVFASGVRVFVICDRMEPEIQAPSEDAIYDQLNQQRVAMMARRYLRDLRRDAIVDYK